MRCTQGAGAVDNRGNAGWHGDTGTMPRRVALPPDLTRGPFTVGEALSAGVSKRRLDGADLDRPFHGVRQTASGFETIEDKCRAYLPRMGPQQFFSHLTSARLWHLPLPERFRAEEPLDVASRSRSTRPRPRGVRGHLLSGVAVKVVRLTLFRTADAASTWCSLSQALSLDDLVVLGDAAVFVPRYFDETAPASRPYATIEELTDRLAAHRGPGKRKLGAALELIRLGCASPMETRLRLLIVRAGLPEPQLNVDILDGRGDFVACGDLYYPEQRVLVEYDGDQHRTDTKTYERDQTRLADLRAIGVECIRVRQAGYFTHPERTIAEITRALHPSKTARAHSG